MKNQITELQAFNAMRIFLENYYELTSSDEIASLLSAMQFLSDNSTADPAIWEDWIKAVSAVRENPCDTKQYLKFKK